MKNFDSNAFKICETCTLKFFDNWYFWWVIKIHRRRNLLQQKNTKVVKAPSKPLHQASSACHPWAINVHTQRDMHWWMACQAAWWSVNYLHSYDFNNSGGPSFNELLCNFPNQQRLFSRSGERSAAPWHSVKMSVIARQQLCTAKSKIGEIFNL